MVNLQKEDGALEMKSRMRYRDHLDFDPDRTLAFDKRSVRDLANRPYVFMAFRRLHYDIIVEGVKDKSAQAKALNIKGVAYYKDGKLEEAMWCFEKALSIDPKYENARKNLNTIDKKLHERRRIKEREAKKGRSFKDITDELEAADTDTSGMYQQQPGTGKQPQEQSAYQYDESANAQQYRAQQYQAQQYQGQQYQGQQYQAQQYQGQQQQGSQYYQGWRQDPRCPGCGIPVRDHWIMCTNCGIDLRSYPPVKY